MARKSLTFFLFLLVFSFSSRGLAHSASDQAWVDVTEGASFAAVGPLDEDIFPSPRGAGMSRALETSADDLDAAVFNPAGIGGYHTGKDGIPVLKRLYFPWSVLTANQNAMNLYREFTLQKGSESSAIGRAIIDAQGGKRQFARAGLTAGIVVGRIMVVPIHDYQVSAASLGQDSGLTQARYRGTSGIGVGGSVQSKDKSLSLGYFAYQVDRSEIEGTFDYSAFIDADVLKAAIKPHLRTFRGTGHTIGATWRPPSKQWNPAFGVSLKDVGDTRFRSVHGEGNKISRQNLSLGVSMGPSVTRNSSILVALGVEKLNDDSVAIGRKSHLGIEWAIGGLGNYATWTIRGGVGSGGGSFGTSFHLGLVGVQFAIQSVDIGENNKKVVEQRRSVNIYVNVAEF